MLPERFIKVNEDLLKGPVNDIANSTTYLATLDIRGLDLNNI